MQMLTSHDILNHTYKLGRSNTEKLYGEEEKTSFHISGQCSVYARLWLLLLGSAIVGPKQIGRFLWLETCFFFGGKRILPSWKCQLVERHNKFSLNVIDESS